MVGYGWLDQAQTIRKLRCQACRKTFSVRKGTPLYYLKTTPDRVEMVLWFLAQGLDRAVLIRYTGHAEAPLARWLQRAGPIHKADIWVICAGWRLQFYNWMKYIPGFAQSLKPDGCGWPSTR